MEIPPQLACHFGPLVQARHLVPAHVRGGKQRVGPLSPGNIHPHRAAGVGHVRRLVSGHFQADVVLGKCDAPDARVDVGLVTAKPQQLRRGEPRRPPGDELAAHFTAIAKAAI